MKLDEAIEILTKERNDHHSFTTDIIGQAEQLGIEALKVIQTIRNFPFPEAILNLPGETND